MRCNEIRICAVQASALSCKCACRAQNSAPTGNPFPSLQKRLTRVLELHELEYDLSWTINGLPFLTPPGTLLDAVRAAVYSETGISAELSTTGGTSDGRFIAQMCPQVIEFGPPNASIHKINEYIAIADIEPLKNIYRRVLENLDDLVRA